MNAVDIADFLTKPIIHRKEIFDLAIGKGQGEGMKIEKWILIEMGPKLKQLRKDGKLDYVECEHKYPNKKSSKYEHCDIWWEVNGEQHWLEVKTINLSNKRDSREFGRTIQKDLEKRKQLNQEDIFHHITFIFPVEKDEKQTWFENLSNLYNENNFEVESERTFELWGDEALLYSLSKLKMRGSMNK